MPLIQGKQQIENLVTSNQVQVDIFKTEVNCDKTPNYYFKYFCGKNKIVER
jgi:hypothetical protein